jgi:hypothetical protein
MLDVTSSNLAQCKLAGVAELELWDFSEGSAKPSTSYQGFI